MPVSQNAQLQENEIEKAMNDAVPEKVPVEEEILLAAEEPLAEAATLEAALVDAEGGAPTEEAVSLDPAKAAAKEATPGETEKTLVDKEVLLIAEEPLAEAVALEAASVQAEQGAPGGETIPPATKGATTEDTLEDASETAPKEEETPAEEPEIDDGRAWFVLHSYSGYENKVKQNLEHRIASMNMQDSIFQVLVPTEEEIEIKEGSRRKTKKRVFPGYILVQMILDEDSWYVVRNTPGVTGFVSSGVTPTPLRPEEIEKILKRMKREAPKIKIGFREGETVRIIDGPFADFVGVVDGLNLDKGRVRVLVSFFGRETPVELDFLQVQK